MKYRFIGFWLFLSITFFASGCNTNSKFEFAQSIDSITKIEIVEITDTEGEKCLAELEPSSGIINDIQSLSCRMYWNDPVQILNGLAIKIYYDEDVYETITCECNAYYSNGDVDYGWEYFDKGEFENLIKTYLK